MLAPPHSQSLDKHVYTAECERPAPLPSHMSVSDIFPVKAWIQKVIVIVLRHQNN